MSRRRKSSPSPAPAAPAGRSLRWLVPLAIVCAGGVLMLALWRSSDRRASAPQSSAQTGIASSSGKPFALEPEAQVFARYAGSESCRTCHAEEHAKWQGSHHGLAERPATVALDGAAFHPPRLLKSGSQSWQMRTNGAELQFITAGLSGGAETFKADRAIGVDPLLQYLVPAGNGRWQTVEMTWDPHRGEWFNVFGDEDRKPGEWGHWTGRGMTWNHMCASCHNTRVRKNYEPTADTYRTTMAEMSVGCEACHGPMRDHVDWQKQYTGRSGDPTLKRFTAKQTLDTCGMCHARRGELTGDFKPGDDFYDHFRLSIPDESNLFYPDGQIWDEDYEFTSFLSSKMHGAGVRCADCHDMHSGKNLLEGNLLCLRCHDPSVNYEAPKIELAAHSFHKPETPGGNCVDCHMPETTYMQRHPRRDHGFTIPDPLLTKQHGIPNACNRCHADKDADWSLSYVEKWYGEKMNRPTRTRAQWVARAKAGERGAHTNLLVMLREEPLPLWRGVAANLLRLWTHDDGVVPALLNATKDTNALVRAMATRALEEPATHERNPAVLTALDGLLNDSSRWVRVEAAWGLRDRVTTNSPAGSEMLYAMNYNRDQPLGLMQLGNYFMERGDTTGALAMFKQAVEWDKGSPPFRHSYAIALSRAGNTDEAVRQLAEACRLAPRDAEMRFTYALSLNEAGRMAEATTALEDTVKIDPQFSRAWYNLGLAYNAAQRVPQALEALTRAESANPRDPQAPYAAATILARAGRNREALEAARRALRIAPNYGEAEQLVRQLSSGPN
jgi:tetratricopeptide (TPR) repeat protein